MPLNVRRRARPGRDLFVPVTAPRPQRFSKVRPLRDLVLVRVDQKASEEMWTGGLIALAEGHRMFPTGVADVIAVGPDVPAAVQPGSRVLVEAMAGPECGQTTLDGADLGLSPGRLAFVHCRDLRCSDEMEERGRREARAFELRKEIKLIDGSPWRKKKLAKKRAALILELETLLLRIDEIDEKRTTLARSRTIKPVKDKGLARGVLAVLDD